MYPPCQPIFLLLPYFQIRFCRVNIPDSKIGTIFWKPSVGYDPRRNIGTSVGHRFYVFMNFRKKELKAKSSANHAREMLFLRLFVLFSPEWKFSKSLPLIRNTFAKPTVFCGGQYICLMCPWRVPPCNPDSFISCHPWVMMLSPDF